MSTNTKTVVVTFNIQSKWTSKQWCCFTQILYWSIRTKCKLVIVADIIKLLILKSISMCKKHVIVVGGGASFNYCVYSYCRYKYSGSQPGGQVSSTGWQEQKSMLNTHIFWLLVWDFVWDMNKEKTKFCKVTSTTPVKWMQLCKKYNISF